MASWERWVVQSSAVYQRISSRTRRRSSTTRAAGVAVANGSLGICLGAQFDPGLQVPATELTSHDMPHHEMRMGSYIVLSSGFLRARRDKTETGVSVVFALPLPCIDLQVQYLKCQFAPVPNRTEFSAEYAHDLQPLQSPRCRWTLEGGRWEVGGLLTRVASTWRGSTLLVISTPPRLK